MAENTVKTYHCKNCETDLKNGVITCPECRLTRLQNLSQFLELADDDTKQLLYCYDRERKNRDKKTIDGLLEQADSWRHTKAYKEEYVRGIRNVLHFTDDGDIEVKRISDIGIVDRKRAADTSKVVGYLKLAASCGSLKALVLVGKSYLAGYGCKRNTISAIAVLCRAAIAGSKEAYRILIQGDEFYKEDFIHRIPSDICDEATWNFGCSYYVNDLTDLRFWLKRDNPIAELERFSASNMLWATYILGELYLKGIFVEKDVSKGIELICKAADDGPYNVQRAIKAKALLQFDKLLKMNENNVDAALYTIWRIENLYVRREAQLQVLMRTSLMPVENGKIRDSVRSRGSQLVWRAIKHFKEVTKAQWITLPDSEEQCKKLSKRMFGSEDGYPGIYDYVIKDDGKKYRYRAPFLGRAGFFGANGVVFHSKQGLYGNLRSKECPNYKFKYNATYNYCMCDYPYPKWDDVDILWLFRKSECRECATDSRMYVDWELQGPVNFKPAGFTDADLLLLIDYVRRYLLSDLRKGVMLMDGSIQKTQFAQKIDVSMEPSAHTKAILKAVGQKVSVNIQGDKTGGGDSSNKASFSETEVDTKAAPMKKRWKFVLIGLLTGWLGLHFLYARRKGWFCFYWLMIIANVVQVNVPSVAEAIGQTPYFGLVAGLMLVGSIFFMKKDGDGNRM